MSTYEGAPCKFGHVMRYLSNNKCVECQRVYRERRSERRSEYNRIWYAGNRDRKLAQNAAWYAANPERSKQTKKEWRDRNIEKTRAWSTRWRIEHLDHARNLQVHVRARKAKAEGTFTQHDIELILHEQGGKCVCGVDLIGCFTIDHVVSMSVGGSNWPENIQLLCKSCNSKKGTKALDKWLCVERTGA